jgi:hypothetical protein
MAEDKEPLSALVARVSNEPPSTPGQRTPSQFSWFEQQAAVPS